MNEQQKTILIIEDEDVLRDSFTYYLEDRDFSVLTANNGKKGIALLQNQRPDLIITDLRMPELDGLGVLRFIRDHTPDIPVIVVSGTGSISDVVNAMKFGAWDYILKPVDEMEIISQAVNKSLERARLIRENKEYQSNLEKMVADRTKKLEKALEKARRSKELEIANRQLEKLNSELKESHEESQRLNEKLQANNEQLQDQRNKLEAALQHLRETQTQLIHAEKMASMGVLTAGVAHELNNPLNFINGSISAIDAYIKESLPEQKEFFQRFIDNINVGVARAVKIIQSLNHFTRQSNTMDEACNLHAIIDNCLTMLSNQLKYKAEVNKNYTTLPFVLKGNEGKLHQLFLNILSNAVQSIEKEGRISIATEIENKHVIITIDDTGSGISQQDLDKIMDPFYTTKPAGEGTGLGLFIAYKILQEHKGNIDFQSKPGKGTSVQLRLPVRVMEEH